MLCASHHTYFCGIASHLTYRPTRYSCSLLFCLSSENNAICLKNHRIPAEEENEKDVEKDELEEKEEDERTCSEDEHAEDLEEINNNVSSNEGKKKRFNKQESLPCEKCRRKFKNKITLEHHIFYSH